MFMAQVNFSTHVILWLGSLLPVMVYGLHFLTCSNLLLWFGYLLLWLGSLLTVMVWFITCGFWFALNYLWFGSLLC